MKSLRQGMDIGLFVLAVVLGGYLASTAGRPTSTELLSRKNHLLPLFLEDEIQQIQVSNLQSGSEVLLRRDDQHPESRRYFLGKTGTQVADVAQIGELLHLLSAATFQRSWPTNAADSPQVDVSTPRLELRLKAGFRSYRVLIGKKIEGAQNSFYAEVSGSNVEAITGVVDSNLVEGLSKPEREYRNGLLFPYSRSRTSSIQLDSAKGKFTLLSDGDGFLVKQEPEGKKVRADRPTTDLLFFQLAGAQISPHLDSETVADALQAADAEVIRLTMKSPDGPPVEVHLGSTCPDEPGALLALNKNADPLAGCVPRSILAALKLGPDDFESLSVAPFNPDEVDHVIITRDNDRLGIMREEGGFVLSRKAQEPVATDAANELFAALTQRKLARAHPESPPAQKKVGEITIRGQTLRSFDPDDPTNDKTEALVETKADIYTSLGAENLLIRRQEDQVWLSVPQALNWAFSTDDSWTRSRTLVSLQAEDIVQVTSSTKKDSRFVRREGSGFTGEDEGKSFVVDPYLARQLFDELAHLEAKRFVTPPLARPQEGLVHIKLDLLSEKPPMELWLGPRVAGGYLAWANFVKGTFVVSHETRLLVETPLFDRSPLLVEPSTLATLELSFDGRDYSFERRGSELIPSGGESNLEMVGALEEALRELQIVSALPNSETLGLRKIPSLKLGGTRLDPQGKAMKFRLYCGSPLSFQGQALRACWNDSDGIVWGATKGSVDQLTSLL